MTSRQRLAALSAWLGVSLAALFFYPLAAAVDADPYYLQWQPAHAGEVAIALVALAIAFAFAVFRWWGSDSRAGTLALFLVVLLPLVSFGAGLSRQLPFDAALRDAWESRAIRFTVPAVGAAIVLTAFLAWPAAFGRWLRRTLLVLSPICLVVIASFAGSAVHAGPRLAIDRMGAASSSVKGCTPVLALMFDELSFSYVYDGADVRDDLREIRRFAGGSTNYLAVTAPGPETLISVPGFLAGRRFREIHAERARLTAVPFDGPPAPFSAVEPDGLFATARRVGLSPEVAGYFLPYCDLLGTLVDACRSFSFYNTATLDDRFSPVHPFLTTLILWPRQFPAGLLKNGPFARLQRGLVESTFAFAARPIDPAHPVFRFVHFSIPHLPFVFDATGYNPPFDPLRQRPDDAYVRQVQYVDRLVGALADRMRQEGTFDRTTIAVFADHGFRAGGRERNPLQIPFIVKSAGQHRRVEVNETAAGEVLLRRIVEDSCRAN
jgi:hypothetical protein